MNEEYYTQNAYDTNAFKASYEPFYNRIRQWHPEKKIILMTSSNFNNWRAYDDYDDYDDHIRAFYHTIKKRGDNVDLIEQRQLFRMDEYDICTTDGIHYTDFGMYRVADAVMECLGRH